MRRSGTRGARRRELEWLAASALLAVTSGCSSGNPAGAPAPGNPAAAELPYASAVVSFEPGDEAGFGEDAFPDGVASAGFAGTAQGGVAEKS